MVRSYLFFGSEKAHNIRAYMLPQLMTFAQSVNKKSFNGSVQKGASWDFIVGTGLW